MSHGARRLAWMAGGIVVAAGLLVWASMLLTDARLAAGRSAGHRAGSPGSAGSAPASGPAEGL